MNADDVIYRSRDRLWCIAIVRAGLSGRVRLYRRETPEVEWIEADPQCVPDRVRRAWRATDLNGLFEFLDCQIEELERERLALRGELRGLTNRSGTECSR